MTTSIKPKAAVVGFLSIFFFATTAEAKGWRGIIPLHTTRSGVEQVLGPPTEQNTSYSVVYRTPNETVLIRYANGRPCGVGEKYSQWRVAHNTVIEIFISPMPGSPLSVLSIDESRYKTLIGRHISETTYIDAREGEMVTVLENVVRSITYFGTADDSHLLCPGIPQPNTTRCEYLSEPFISVGDIGFEPEKFLLDNFFLAVSEREAIAYIIAYGGKRARPAEAKKRADRAKQYLVTVRRFPKDKIKVIDGGYREKRELVLYVVSEGVCPPTPVPTVDPRDVQIMKRG